jgi:hypothetical protein
VGALLLGLLLTTANYLQAQNLGSISGVVTDNAGLAVPNAAVRLTSQDTGLVRTFGTNESGNYTAPAVPVGAYTLEVYASGFATFKQTGIQVNLRDAIRIDAQLNISSVQETVEVKAEAVQIQTENATVGYPTDRTSTPCSRACNASAATVPAGGTSKSPLQVVRLPKCGVRFCTPGGSRPRPRWKSAVNATACRRQAAPFPSRRWKIPSRFVSLPSA